MKENDMTFLDDDTHLVLRHKGHMRYINMNRCSNRKNIYSRK